MELGELQAKNCNIEINFIIFVDHSTPFRGVFTRDIGCSLQFQFSIFPRYWACE